MSAKDISSEIQIIRTYKIGFFIGLTHEQPIRK